MASRRGTISAPPADCPAPPARRRHDRRTPTGRAASRRCRGRPSPDGPKMSCEARKRFQRLRQIALRHQHVRRHDRRTPTGRAASRRCRGRPSPDGPQSRARRGTISAPPAIALRHQHVADTIVGHRQVALPAGVAGSAFARRSLMASPARNDFSAPADCPAPPARRRHDRRTPTGRAASRRCRGRPSPDGL